MRQIGAPKRLVRVLERWMAGVIGILAMGAGLLFAVLPFSFEVGSGETR